MGEEFSEDDVWKNKDFIKAIRDLPARQKSMYTLRRLGKMKYKEIATVMNCEVGTVSSTIKAARNTLEKKFRDEVL